MTSAITVRNIAIIPARGGSKRIPRKNIVEFGGKPMIAWTIAAALDTRLFDRVIVSTEDTEIAAVARSNGAEVPFMRTVHFDDHTPISKVTLDVLENMERQLGLRCETVTQLMANCPLRTAVDIENAMRVFEQTGRKIQLSCFRFGWQNPWWALKRDDGGRGDPLFDVGTIRSQDLPPLYCPTGAIWIASTDALRAAGSFYAADRHYEPLPWTSAVDIDDAEDLEFARAVHQMRITEGSAPPISA